jgi:hypothetical protein
MNNVLITLLQDKYYRGLDDIYLGISPEKLSYFYSANMKDSER